MTIELDSDSEDYGVESRTWSENGIVSKVEVL